MFPAARARNGDDRQRPGRHGHRRADGDRGQARPPRPARRDRQRRRRLPHELPGARDRGAPAHADVNIIWENRQFGSIVWKQDKKFGRHFGVDFTNPDFVKLAEAFGCAAFRCDSVDDFGDHLAHGAGPGSPLGHRRAHRLLHRRGSLGRARNGDRGHMTTTATKNESAVLDGVPKQLYIGGEWRDATEGGTLPVEDPATGETIAEVADATPDDAVARARRRRRRRRPSGPRTPPRERGEILRRAFEAMTERADDLALLMTLEMGKAARRVARPRSPTPPSSSAGSPRRRCASTAATRRRPTAPAALLTDEAAGRARAC